MTVSNPWRGLLALLLPLMLLAPMTGAQDEGKPGIAILRIGSNPGITLGEKGLLDMLQAYEMINAEERAILDGANSLEGDTLNILYRDAGNDLPTANLMIEDVIDRGAEVLVTYSVAVTRIAANIIRVMDDPPAIIFAIVSTPYFAGIADAPCVKDAHIAGTQILHPYAEAVDLLPIFDPDITVIGTIENASAPNEVFGAQRIAELAAALGIATETATIVSLADLSLAVESLIDNGARAIFMPGGFTAGTGMPVISSVAAEHGLPVLATNPTFIFTGATLVGGFYSMYQEGVAAGRMLVAHLNGDVDLGRTAINSTPGFTVAVNQDAAAAAGLEILAELNCTDEIIAAQMRQLETQWGD